MPTLTESYHELMAYDVSMHWDGILVLLGIHDPVIPGGIVISHTWVVFLQHHLVDLE